MSIVPELEKRIAGLSLQVDIVPKTGTCRRVSLAQRPSSPTDLLFPDSVSERSEKQKPVDILRAIGACEVHSMTLRRLSLHGHVSAHISDTINKSIVHLKQTLFTYVNECRRTFEVLSALLENAERSRDKLVRSCENALVTSCRRFAKQCVLAEESCLRFLSSHSEVFDILGVKPPDAVSPRCAVEWLKGQEAELSRMFLGDEEKTDHMKRMFHDIEELTSSSAAEDLKAFDDYCDDLQRRLSERLGRVHKKLRQSAVKELESVSGRKLCFLASALSSSAEVLCFELTSLDSSVGSETEREEPLSVCALDDKDEHKWEDDMSSCKLALLGHLRTFTCDEVKNSLQHVVRTFFDSLL